MATPYSPEAEQQLLGEIFYDSRAMDEVIETITPRHFMDIRHRIIFSMMLFLSETRSPITTTSMYLALKARGRLESAGGPGYVAFLSGLSSTASNIKYWMGILQEAFTRRGLMNFGQLLTAEAQATSDDFQRWLADMGRKFTYAQTQGQTAGPRLSSKIVDDTFEEIEAVMDGKIKLGIKSGLNGLDIHTGGFKRGELIILAGRPGQGKSAMALAFIYAAALQGHFTELVSLEMGEIEIMRRLISMIAEAPTDCRERNGQDWKRLMDAQVIIHGLPLAIDDSAALNIQQLRARARRLKADFNLKLLVVDYLQLMETERIKGQSREREVAELSRNLKALARELEIPVIALSQLNREADGREAGRPHLSDLRESGALEQDADVVLSIYRPWCANQEKFFSDYARCEILKQRNGVSGVVIPLRFSGAISRFIAWSGDESGKKTGG